MMIIFRRLYLPNATYFFTAVTNNRIPLFSNDSAKQCLKEAIIQTQKKHPFTIQAFVLLPDHIHTIWSLPEEDYDYSKRWRLIKYHFLKSQKIDSSFQVMKTPAQIKKKESGLWQRRFWDHLIRDEKDFENHFNYIHYNPVKHGYVSSPKDWPWSTFHRYVRKGWLSDDWGSSIINIDENQQYGE